MHPEIELARSNAVRDQKNSWDELNAFVSEYVSEYELRADQDHKPDELASLMITDAITGLLADEKFIAMVTQIGQRDKMLKSLP